MTTGYWVTGLGRGTRDIDHDAFEGFELVDAVDLGLADGGLLLLVLGGRGAAVVVFLFVASHYNKFIIFIWEQRRPIKCNGAICSMLIGWV